MKTLNPLESDQQVRDEYNDYLSKIEKPFTDKDFVLMQHQYLKDLPDSEIDLDNFSQIEYDFYELAPRERELVIDSFLIELEENAYIDDEHALDHLYATYLRTPIDDQNMRPIDDWLELLEENRFYHGGSYSGDSYDTGDRDKLFVYARYLAHHSIVSTAFNKGTHAFGLEEVIT